MDEREIRNFGYCKNCDDEVTDEGTEYYITEDGELFCCLDCLLEHFGIVKIEV